MSALKFHLDENVNNAIAEGLRRRGIDVTISVEVGLIQAEDEDQLAFAFSQGRVLATQDRDHLVLSAKGVPHAGIAYWKQHSLSIGQVISSLIELHDNIPPEDMVGQVEWL